MQLAPGIEFRQLEVLWDVRSAGLDILSALGRERERSIERIVEEMAQACAIAESARSFTSSHYARPPGHARSFFMHTPGGGVIVFKGTEPMSRDHASIMEEAYSKRSLVEWSPFDHFILLEDEVYLALTARGALSCATRTCEWVRDYVTHFARIPRTPFPLMAFRIPGDIAETYKTTLSPYLSDRIQLSARARVSNLIEKGLGVYAYYYPGIPIRVAHALGEFPGAFDVGIGDTDKISFNVDSAVDSWVELLSDMLVLGYLPTTPIHTGNCLQSQNMVIDGGFCDVDSIEKAANLRHERDVAGALLYSMGMFTATVADAIGLPRESVGHFLWQEVCERTTRKARDHTCDERILEAVRMTGLAGLRWLSNLASR